MFDYLANYPEVKKQKEAAKKVERPASGANSKGIAEAVSAASQQINVFAYRPEGADYTVEVKFDNSDGRNRRGVLTALKQAFDDVKSEKADV